MNNVIKNRHDFVYLFDCTDGNPNGDPDAGFKKLRLRGIIGRRGILSMRFACPQFACPQQEQN